MNSSASGARVFINMSIDEKNELVVKLKSQGCREIEQSLTPGRHEYCADSWNPDPLDPGSRVLWIVKIGPE
ncbi:hypothetical protein [Motiliproteus sp. MSK22-1]|uniref:hypothetical protein n=1 Tax=Motiliproteus sp. MSK22-1 TaxID=1897630 RepID=UPI000976C4E4|nr:hypothetical protein [Motiliproteus sp. MSK22-1]OMH29076.1 hypothetical protein BGP75_20185 [Motiliproteus sp. MSK22-1]